MEEGPVEFTATRSSNVTIPCAVRGKPKPQIIWIYQGVVLSADDKYHMSENNSLIVKSITADDVGDYVCIARNNISSASKTFTLKIKGKSS